MSESFKKVTNKNVVDQVIDSLTDSVISGKFPSGSKLPSEYELMEELGVSRNSLREAMKILSAVGIVEIRRGDGTYVCSSVKPSVFDTAIYSIIYSGSSDEELLELRREIDESILRFAMLKITPDEIERLKDNLREFGEALDSADYEKAEQLDYAFHLGLIDACKNKLYIHLMKEMYSIFEKSIIQTVEFEKNRSQALQHHQAILKCVEDKNEAGVKTVIAASLQTWKSSKQHQLMRENGEK